MSTYNGSGLVYDQSNLTFDGNPAGLANMPVMGVFIAFDDGPYVADPDWVEVTNYVRDINIRRGRQDDLQQFPSGSCSLTLDNRARLFDPFNTSGTYYGKLKPRRQIKVVGQWAGVNYDLFRGFIAGWPVEYSVGGKDSTVSIDCFDALGLLATEKTPADWVTDATLALSPSRYWKLDEGPNTTSFASKVGNVPLATSIAPVSSIKLAPAVSSDSVYAPTFIGFLDDAGTTLSQLSMSFWAAGPTGLVDSTTQYQVRSGKGSINRFRVNATPGVVTLQANYGNVTYRIQASASDSTYRFDSPTHFVVTFNKSGNTFTIYINGVSVGVASPTSFADSVINTESHRAESCSVQEWSVYDRVLTAAEALQLYNYGAGKILQKTDQRLNTVLADTSFPSSLVSLPASTTATVTDLKADLDVPAQIAAVASSENGEVFVSASGVLTFVDRYGWATRTRSNTSQVSFTDSGTGVYYDYQSIAVDLNADRIRNDSIVSFAGNGQRQVVDDSSVGEFGAASESVSTLLSTVEQAETLADYRVLIYSQPKIEVEPFLVKGQRNPSYDWPRLLNLELLDRFTFVRTPSVGSAIQKDMLLQSIEHRITPGTWETIINGSARYTGWFILGVSLLGSTEDVLL